MMVDTLTIARELKAAELPAAQAEAIAAAIGRSIGETAATKADLDQARTALKADLREAELRLEAKLDQLQAKLLTWIMSAMVALAGVIIAVVKL